MAAVEETSAAAAGHRYRMDRRVPRGEAHRYAGLGALCHLASSSSSASPHLHTRAGRPFAVMLIVPLGVVGALLAATGRGLTNDKTSRSAC